MSSIAGGVSIENLTHSFDDDLVLNNINCLFPAGSFVAVLGPSGCGKTTLLKCAAGLIRPAHGHITLDGIDPPEARRNGVVGFAFQSPTLLPWRSALENVLLPLEIFKRPQNGEQKHAKTYAKTYAKELLTLLDLKDDVDKFPKQLSGGMQQRVGLARALVTHPSHLFLDEPFGALDGITRDRLNVKVREIWQKYKLTIMFVTHSVEEAIFLSDRILILTSRPARVLADVEIELGEHRDASTRARSEFFDYQKSIRRLTEGLT